MKLKPGVIVQGISNEAIFGVLAAQAVYQKYGLDFVITSMLDGKHSSKSKHYRGDAVDIRTRHIQNDNMKAQIVADIKSALGDDYDVILESTHIHLEYDPRR